MSKLVDVDGDGTMVSRDPSGLWEALEAQVGAATLWQWTKEWIEFMEVDWDESEKTPLSQFLYERAGMDAEDQDFPRKMDF